MLYYPPVTRLRTDHTKENHRTRLPFAIPVAVSQKGAIRYVTSEELLGPPRPALATVKAAGIRKRPAGRQRAKAVVADCSSESGNCV